MKTYSMLCSVDSSTVDGIPTKTKDRDLTFRLVLKISNSKIKQFAVRRSCPVHQTAIFSRFPPRPPERAHVVSRFYSVRRCSSLSLPSSITAGRQRLHPYSAYIIHNHIYIESRKSREAVDRSIAHRIAQTVGFRGSFVRFAKTVVIQTFIGGRPFLSSIAEYHVFRNRQCKTCSASKRMCCLC